MTYENHQSAQFGIEQRGFLYTPIEMHVFFFFFFFFLGGGGGGGGGGGFARNYNQDVCGLKPAIGVSAKLF